MLYIPFDYARGRLKIYQRSDLKNKPNLLHLADSGLTPFTSPFEKTNPIGRLCQDTRNEGAELKEQSQFAISKHHSME